MKRILEIAERGTSLRVLDGTLAVQPPEQPEFSVPPDDLGSVLLSTPAASLSGAALAALAAADVPVVVCDDRHYPRGMFVLPVDTKAQGLAYRRLRKALRFFGFEFLQKSVYARWEESDATADHTLSRLSEWIPEEGDVAVFRLSERTMRHATFLTDRKRTEAPSPPDVYVLC